MKTHYWNEDVIFIFIILFLKLNNEIENIYKNIPRCMYLLNSLGFPKLVS